MNKLKEKKEIYKMTKERKEEIFSQEYLSINDIGEILGLSYQMAAKKMREIKRKNDRLKLQGKLYIQDYFDYFDKEISR
jgi:hypothetical protein